MLLHVFLHALRWFERFLLKGHTKMASHVSSLINSSMLFFFSGDSLFFGREKDGLLVFFKALHQRFMGFRLVLY